MPDLLITDTPLGTRPFRGIGTEADAYIFDEVNRACGVTETDLELIARRLHTLQPGLARLFVDVGWFNPSFDGVTFTWDSPGYTNLVRQLRLLCQVGAAVNLVLFQPYPKRDANLEPAVHAMLTLLERLAATEKLDHIRWLTLWNEPDSLFPHDSPLYRRIFGEESLTKRPPWSEYVRLNRLAYQGLTARGLYPRTKLAVADTVWGAPMRLERMRLSAEAFGDLDVSYSYHNYNPEQPGFYKKDNPDYAYAGIAAEATAFRELLGPHRELILWEFNTTGLAGFGTYFLGVGPGGIDQVSTIAGAVDVAAKVLAGAAHGVDGFCLWCLHDMIYCGSINSGLMPCGLWRYRWQQWLPRPLYHYYAPLCRAFRPGTQLLRVTGHAPGVVSLAVRHERELIVALLNQSGAPTTLALRGFNGDPLARSRVHPSILPTESDLPFSDAQTVPPTGDVLTMDLAIDELTILRSQMKRG